MRDHSMMNAKPDRRIQRTRQLLRDALLTLIEESGYEKITVQNIIDRANVGRSTFYAHYKDKEDLMLSGLDEVVHHLTLGVEHSPRVARSGSPQRIIYTAPLFQHVEENFRLHKSIVGSHGIEIIIRRLLKHLSGHIQEHLEERIAPGRVLEVPTELIAHQLAGSVLNLLRWWLDHNRPTSPERTDEMFQKLVMPGVWALLDE